MNNFYSKIREELHQIPEIALNEFKTANYIRSFLNNLEIPFQEIGTSTVALFNGEKDIWLAFRADIDALPMKEENDSLYKSNHEGMMHACGHDGHTTNLLYMAKWLKESINNGVKLKKSVMLIFQAGEEGAGGSRFIADHPVYKDKNIEAIFALHVDPELKEGKVGTIPGALTYQNVLLDITVTGKGCHGAQPFRGIDSILVTAKLIEAYQSIVSRNVEPENPLVLTIGSIHAGTVRNIIPEKVDLLGTIRLIDKGLIPHVQKRMEDINSGFEISYGVKIDMEFKPFYPAIINSNELFNLYEKVVPEDIRVNNIKLAGSEDFSFYLQNGVPGLMFLLGIRNEERGFTYALHNSKFDFNPEALILGFEIFKKFLNELGAVSEK